MIRIYIISLLLLACVQSKPEITNKTESSNNQIKLEKAELEKAELENIARRKKLEAISLYIGTYTDDNLIISIDTLKNDLKLELEGFFNFDHNLRAYLKVKAVDVKFNPIDSTIVIVLDSYHFYKSKDMLNSVGYSPEGHTLEGYFSDKGKFLELMEMEYDAKFYLYNIRMF